MSDMNVHHVKWLRSGNTSRAGALLKTIADNYGFSQLTRDSTHRSGNIPDLTLTGMKELRTAKVWPMPSDHHPVCLDSAVLRRRKRSVQQNSLEAREGMANTNRILTEEYW